MRHAHKTAQPRRIRFSDIRLDSERAFARMRLLDQVAQARTPIEIALSNGELTRLPGGEIFASEVARCPLRYVLEDEVAALCAEIAFDGEAMLARCCDILRAPASSLWIEYRHGARRPALAARGLAPSDTLGDNARVGAFLQCAPDRNRAGRIALLWENEQGMGPELCPVFAEFDLDDASFGAARGGSLRDMLPKLAQLEPLLDHLRFGLEPAWAQYYKRHSRSEAEYRAAIGANLAFILGDIPMVFSLLLLNMSERALRSTDVDHSRLNGARARKGKAALLNHVELRLSVPGEVAEEDRCQDLDERDRREAPRLHLVRGHLVRRRNQIFWRAAHLRGDAAKGEVKTRTYRVALSRR
jgi:hypothetical protein